MHPPHFARSVASLTAALVALAGCSRPAPPSAGAPPPAVSPPGAPAAAPRASFAFATQTLSVPAGFTVELVAGPPLVNRPISIAFDEQGRLYATDSSGLSERSDKQFEQKPHRVVRLEDADGDGRYERSTVFAERMMFPQGALFYEGSLYVGAPPHIWKLTDTNGDGVADERVAWYDGKTLTGCANDLHGPYLGPEGWIYWTKGAWAEQHHIRPDGRPYTTRAAHIFRSPPGGGSAEPVLTGGMDNPVGLTFTLAGERILSGTFFQVGVAGQRDGLIHAIYGGVYGKEQPSTQGHIRTGDLMPIMTHMGPAAPCGSTTYRSHGFGRDFQDNLFVCYFNLRKVSRHQLVPDGATFRTIDTDFVTSDNPDFRPTDVLEDADGSLLVVDTGGWYKICCPTSQLAKPDVLGGIYRIRRVGAPRVEDPRGLALAWADQAPAALAKRLADERPYVQDRAIHLLGRTGGAAVAALQEVLTATPTASARRNAAWALARIDTPAARAAVRSALQDRDPAVLQVALQVVSLWRDGDAVTAVTPLLAADRPALARLAAEALGRIGDPRAIDPILAAVRGLKGTEITPLGAPADPAERILEHALIYALIEIGRRDPLLARLASDEHPRVVRAALVALDQMPGGGLEAEPVVRRLDSPVARLRQTAGWLVGFHPEWGSELSRYFRARLAAPAPGDAEGSALETQLTQLARAAAIQDLLGSLVSDPGAGRNAQRIALRAMAASGVREAPSAWLNAVAELLARGDVELTRQAIATARGLPLPKGGHAAFTAALARVGRDSAIPADVRLDALATTTPAAWSPVEPALFDFLCAHLDSAKPILVRTTAATALGKAPLTPPQQQALADLVRTVGALEAPKLLPAFERSPNEPLGRKLIAALRQSPGLPGVRVHQLRPLFAKYPPSLQPEVEALLGVINADAARQNARVDELLAGVKNGDIRRGQALFNSEKTACTLCHVTGHTGGRLGPDLTSIGRIRSERELLEAVVYPNATFVRGYEPFVVTLRNGETLSGILRSDTPEEVVLATGPDTERRIARGDIADLQPGAVSPMPPGMDAVLSPSELADLVAFLKSRS